MRSEEKGEEEHWEAEEDLEEGLGRGTGGGRADAGEQEAAEGERMKVTRRTVVKAAMMQVMSRWMEP